MSFSLPFSLSTLISSLVTVFWMLFICNFFSIFSGVGERFASDNDDDDKDDDGGDEEDDDGDDDWLLCCNCNISLHLANWFNNELIISSLDFICFRRKYTSSNMWAVNILEPSMGESTTFSNEFNNLLLNDLTLAKNYFFSLSKSSIKSSSKLLKFSCRFAFLIALCFLRERHVLFQIRLHFTEPLSIKEFRVLSKCF